MRDLNDLQLFVQVVERSGFAAAARKLGMPRSRLSRRIGMLEEQLGVRLIQRSTRHFAVTEIGQEYYRHCVAMLVEADAAQEAIDRSRAAPQGIVRVSCPVALVHFRVAEIVARFMGAWPKVEVHLESTNRRVDVISEGIDIAIRVRFPPLEESDLVMKILGDSTQRLVASPRLVEKLSMPLVPADLSMLPSLSWSSPQGQHEWHLNGADGATAVIPYKPRYVTEDMMALRFAALCGIGVGQFPTMVIGKDFEDGTLVDILPDWAPKQGIVHALLPSRRGQLPAVRALLDFLAAEYIALDREEAKKLKAAGSS